MILLIDQKATEEVQRVIDYAKLNPYSMERLKNILKGTEPVAGDQSEFSCYISNHKVVYTIEEGRNRISDAPIWVKHLSISVGNARLPSIAAVNMILELFKFTNRVKDPPQPNLVVWFENEENNNLPTAVNLVELYASESNS